MNVESLASVDMCNSTLFDEKTGLFNDSCFQRDRDRQSVESAKYGAYNFRNIDACGRDVLGMATCHPNLRFKNGYGNLSPCNVDDDSRVRINDPKATNPRHRQQINTRTAQAGPDLSRGFVQADVESDLIHQETSRTRRECSTLSGVSTDVFTPLLPCIRNAQRVENVVPGWGGAVDTRAWIRDADYIKRCKLDR